MAWLGGKIRWTDNHKILPKLIRLVALWKTKKLNLKELVGNNGMHLSFTKHGMILKLQIIEADIHGEQGRGRDAVVFHAGDPRATIAE